MRTAINISNTAPQKEESISKKKGYKRAIVRAFLSGSKETPTPSKRVALQQLLKKLHQSEYGLY